jgi:hypothetical protein
MLLLRHLSADLLQFARGRMGNLLATACILVLGAHFSLLGASSHRDFLSFTYVYFPTLFLTLSALSISWERHTRFSDMVLVGPISRQGYYGSKLLGAMTLGAGYLLLTLPFAFIFAWMAGWSWLPHIGYHIALGGMVVVATSCLGLLLSVLFTQRGFLPAMFTGFGLAAVFTQWEFLIRIVRNVVHPEHHGEVLRFLAISPAYAAANASPFFRVVDAPSPLSLVLTSLGVSALFAILGLVAFTRLQNADAWDAKPILLATFLAIAATTPALAVAASPEGDLADPGAPQGMYGSFRDASTGIGFGLEPRHWGKSVDGGPTERAVLREPTTDPWVIYFFQAENASYTLHNVTLRLRSEDWRLNETVFRFGTVHVPANGEPGPADGGPSWHLVPSLEATPVRMDAAYAVGKSWFNYTLESDEHVWTSDQYVAVRPPVAYPYLYPALLTVGMALGVRVLWWKGGWRR